MATPDLSAIFDMFKPKPAATDATSVAQKPPAAASAAATNPASIWTMPGLTPQRTSQPVAQAACEEPYDPSSFVSRADQVSGFIEYSGNCGRNSATSQYGGISFADSIMTNADRDPHYEAALERKKARDAESRQVAQQQAQQQGAGFSFFQLT